jgi:hypothetical protein
MGLVELRHGSGSYVAGSYDGILHDSPGMLVQLEDVGAGDLIGPAARAQPVLPTTVD